MDIINENLTEKQTKDTLNPENSIKKRQRIPYFDVNIKERITMTAQDIDNKQKLYDFISTGKNKLSLKTHFDQKGTKEFLHGKNEAMKKIELNESIEEKNSIIPKKIKNKTKLKTHKSQKILTKLDSMNANNIKKKIKNSLSTQNLGKFYKNKLSSIKQQHIMIGIEDEVSPSKWEPHTPINCHKKNRKSLSKRKNKGRKKTFNVDKSINSINTVDSKLFKDQKDYEHYKHHFLNKDDTSFLEAIINELDLNEKEIL